MNIIKGRTAASGFTVTDLSKRTGINRRTLYNRLQNPDKLMLMELRAIDRHIHLTDAEILRLVRRGS